MATAIDSFVYDLEAIALSTIPVEVWRYQQNLPHTSAKHLVPQILTKIDEAIEKSLSGEYPEQHHLAEWLRDARLWLGDLNDQLARIARGSPTEPLQIQAQQQVGTAADALRRHVRLLSEIQRGEPAELERSL